MSQVCTHCHDQFDVKTFSVTVLAIEVICYLYLDFIACREYNVHNFKRVCPFIFLRKRIGKKNRRGTETKNYLAVNATFIGIKLCFHLWHNLEIIVDIAEILRSLSALRTM